MKKMERSMKELELQEAETTQSLERQVEQITTLSNRNKQLKIQFADSVCYSRNYICLFINHVINRW